MQTLNFGQSMLDVIYVSQNKPVRVRTYKHKLIYLANVQYLSNFVVKPICCCMQLRLHNDF